MPEVNIIAFADKYLIYNTGTASYTAYNNTGVSFGMPFSTSSSSWIGLFAFELASLPSNITINSVTMYIKRQDSNTSTNVVHYGSSPSFAEDNVIPNVGQMLTNYNFTIQNAWNTIDVTELAIAALAGTKKLYVNLRESADFYSVYSREVAGSEPYIKVVYTINKPNAPTNLSPYGETKQRDQVIRFSWQYNPTQSDTQLKFDLQYSSDGTNWSTITQTTSNAYYDMPANTLPVGTIYWKVSAYGQNGLASDYSSQAVFTSAGKPAAPTITQPSATVNVARPTVAWSSAEQAAYQLQVLDSLGSVYWDGGEINTTVKTQQIGKDLENSKNYTVRVRVKNIYSIWGDWATKSIATSFPVPAKPAATIAKHVPKPYSITITITNPAPGSGQDTFAKNAIFRKRVDEIAWIKIADNLAAGSSFEDFSLGSGMGYAYYIRAYGANGGYADSDTITTSISLKYAILISTTDKSKYVTLKYNGSRQQVLSLEMELMSFAGRKKAIAEIGEHESFGLNLRYTIKDDATYNALMELIRRKEVLLYRDKTKRIFCTVGGLQVTEDTTFKRYDIELTLAENDYMEGL